MREEGTLLGQAAKDILLGWFAAGPAVVLFWIFASAVSGLALQAVRAAARGFSDSAADWAQFFLSVGLVVALCVLSLALLSRRYRFLAWSFVVSALLACGFLSLLGAEMQAGLAGWS